MRPTLCALFLLLAACGKPAPQPPPPVTVVPEPPKPDWLTTLAEQAGIEAPTAGPLVPTAAVGVDPQAVPVVVVGPQAITFDGTVLVRAAVVEGRIDAPAAQGRRIDRHAVVGQLFDAAKAKNPAYSFNAKGGTTGPRKPVLMVADARAPMGLLERARWSVWHAGWEPTGWVVRGADGPAVLSAPEAPRCRAQPPLRITEMEGGALAGSPSAMAISPATVVGPCAPESQDGIFRSLAELLGVCWGRTVEAVSMLQGERDDATITWVTAPDGSVEGVFLESAFIGYGAGFGDCVLRAVKSKRHAPQPQRCIATSRVSYQSGELADRLAVEPRAGEPKPLATPLVHAECLLSPTALGFELFGATDGSCGTGPSVWAQVQLTGLDHLSGWLGEVTGAGGTRLQSANVHVAERATLGETLAALQALGRAGEKPALRLATD